VRSAHQSRKLVSPIYRFVSLMPDKPLWPILRVALTERRWQATLLAVGASLLTTLLLGVSWYRSVEGARSASMTQLGNAAAAQLAALAIEPLITLDRIRLGVLATRMSELPELESVTIITVDDRIMANAGPRPSADAKLFTRSMEFEGATAGYVQVAVAPGAFGAAGYSSTYLLLPALIAALLAAAAGYLLGLRLELAADRDDAAEPLDADAETPESGNDWLLTVNLFNLMTLPSTERATVLAEVRRRASRIASEHGAALHDLPNTGCLLTFGDADAEQCYRILCVGLLLAGGLDELNETRHVARRPELKFRFGVHAVPHGEMAIAHRTDVVHDALVLSAVAPEGSIAVSREAFAALQRPERFIVEVLANPILKTLATSAHDSCVVVSAVADAYGAALDRQAERLRAEEDSISTPSAH
jgi:hypothetical protein